MGGKFSVAGKDIPDDILTDILNRLPVKSLARLRSVSRQWRSIISDPLFAKPHLNPNRRHLLFFSSSHLKSLPLNEPIPSSPPIKNLTCPLKLPKSESVLKSTKILGSCNGMVCLSFNTNLYVWNPTTGFLRRLPEPGFPLRHVMHHGFGHCSATDDYKVVVAIRRYDHFCNWSNGETEVWLFSWRAGVWRTIESPLTCYVLPRCGAYLQDRLHWLQQADRPICVFDLVEEEFRTMPAPHFLVSGDRGYWKCDSWGGNLYVFRRRFLSDWQCVEAIQLWVMREYGVGESWKKLCDFEFSPVVYLPRREPVARFPFLALGESSTVVVVTPLVSKMPYEIRIQREGKQLVVNLAGESGKGISDMIVYEESLLQLPECRVPAQPKSRGIIARCKCFWGIESWVAGTSA